MAPMLLDVQYEALFGWGNEPLWSISLEYLIEWTAVVISAGLYVQSWIFLSFDGLIGTVTFNPIVNNWALIWIAKLSVVGDAQG